MNISEARTSPATLTFYNGFRMVGMVFFRLWLALIALPAGLILSALLVANDFYPPQMLESIYVSTQDLTRSIEPGIKAGTYRWEACLAPATFPPTKEKSVCDQKVTKEGTLQEALSSSAAILTFAYLCIAGLSLGLMIMKWPESRFRIRRFVRLKSKHAD